MLFDFDDLAKIGLRLTSGVLEVVGEAADSLKNLLSDSATGKSDYLKGREFAHKQLLRLDVPQHRSEQLLKEMLVDVEKDHSSSWSDYYQGIYDVLYENSPKKPESNV